MSYIPLNFSILAHPVNWLMVAVMVAFGVFALSLLSHGIDLNKGKNS